MLSGWLVGFQKTPPSFVVEGPGRAVIKAKGIDYIKGMGLIIRQFQLQGHTAHS